MKIKTDYAYSKIIKENKLKEFMDEYNKLHEELDKTDLVTLVNLANMLNTWGFEYNTIMNLLNSEMHGYGVEAITDENTYVSSYWINTIALYVNMGDTYDETIIYDTIHDEFDNCSWGSWYEEFESQTDLS